MLEDPFVHGRLLHTPRASLVLAAGEAANTHTEIWMGGAHSVVGELLVPGDLAGSWLIDCAGEFDRAYRDSLGRWLSCVFPDLDGPLSASNRVHHVVEEAVNAVLAGNGTAPERIYVMCQHGMNRSGLVAGLIMRSFGVTPVEAVDRIRAARPGALANDSFRRLILRS